MSSVDHYGVLGVPRTASADEIKRAYRVKARETHPDLNPNAGSEEAFKAVGRAFEVLGDPKSRAAYDVLGSDPKMGRQFRPSTAGQGFAPQTAPKFDGVFTGRDPMTAAFDRAQAANRGVFDAADAASARIKAESDRFDRQQRRKAFWGRLFG